MDGIKGVIPNSCHDEITKEETLFGDAEETVVKCEGCEKENIKKHNGIYCFIMDWEKKKPIRYIDLIK